jgi:drug/metabolite transporter (DMT)-like permease
VVASRRRGAPASREPPLTLSALALAVVAACALAWSGFDLSRKALVARIAPTPLILLLTAGQVPLFGLWVALDGWPDPAPDYWAPAVASVLLNIVANLAFIHAFRLAPISVTIPLLSLTPALTAVAAVPMLGELPAARQVVGIGLVVLGAFLLGRQPVAGGGARRLAGVVLMLVVVATWSLTPPLDKLALQEASTAFHGLVLSGGVALGALAILAWQRRLGEVRQVARAPWIYLFALVVSTVALALQLIAMRLVYVAFVETFKRGLGNALALVYGRFIFGERVGASQVAAVCLLALGVALVLA